MKGKLKNKIVSLVLAFNLVFSNFGLLVSFNQVRAQDITPEPTQEQTITPAPEEIAPTAEITPAQEVSPTPSVEITPR